MLSDSSLVAIRLHRAHHGVTGWTHDSVGVGGKQVQAELDTQVQDTAAVACPKVLPIITRMGPEPAWESSNCVGIAVGGDADECRLLEGPPMPRGSVSAWR